MTGGEAGGISIHDFWISHSYRERCLDLSNQLKMRLTSLGFVVNQKKKSVKKQERILTFLGMESQ